MDFILAEDALTSAEIRRILAAENITGTRVGNMDALLQTLAELWLLRAPQEDWDRRLRHAALSLPDAFWARSIQADEARTLDQLSQGLDFLLKHVELGVAPTRIQSPATRYERYYNDLVRLHVAMDYLRPASQMLANLWYESRHLTSIEPLSLHVHLDRDRLPPWQRVLIDALPTFCAETPCTRALDAASRETVNRDASLKDVTDRLFKSPTSPVGTDHLHWLTCRDAWQETEAVTAMIQQAIEQGTPPKRIAVVVPKGSSYAERLRPALNRAGILLSNTRSGVRIQDWQTTLLHDLIHFRRNPSIPMACMSVLTNPVMPWSSTQGHQFAERVARGEALQSSDHKEQAMLDALLREDVPWELEVLLEWFREVTGQCRSFNEYALTHERMSSLLKQLGALLDRSHQDSLERQLDRAAAQMPAGNIALNNEAIRLLDAVTLVNEDQTLPFSVDELFLLGFNEGSYQYTSGKTGPIPRELWTEVGARAGLNIPSLQKAENDWQEQLRALIGCAQKRATFTLALSDTDSSELAPSASLVDFALCLMPAAELEPESLLKPASAFEHPLLAPKSLTAKPPIDANLEDLALNTDLLQAKNSHRRKPISESPSSLERLMLSPLLWVLNRFGLKSWQWTTLAADPLVQGNVAHRVFELFADNTDVGWDDAQFDEAFQKAIQEKARFMNRPEWTFEQRQLRQQVYKALTSFLNWCQETQWRIGDVETPLEGTLWGIEVSGLADAVLRNGAQTLILDYKKSKHDNYLTRLNKGYDLQTYIYRSLFNLQTDSGVVASGYFTMNDAHLISDNALPEAAGIKIGQPEIPLAEQSSNASAQITKRISELKKGLITLNTEQDVKNWEQLGVKPYQLKESPENALLRRFTRTSKEADE